jgi:hypothetical protein
MSTKRLGWCRLTGELVLDAQILNIPYLRDDMDVYSHNGAMWLVWTPESQCYSYITLLNVPELIKLAMVMLE